MRYTNTAIKELKKRYKNILIKCALLNMALFMSFSAYSETITSGSSQLYLFNDGKQSVITDSTYQNIKTDNNGAIAWVTTQSTLTVSNSTFENNTGYIGGALGIGTAGKKLIINNKTRFINNHATDGGAIGNYSGLNVSDAYFEGNTAQLTGENYDQVITGDTGPVGGGAISLGAISATEIGSITDTVFKANKSGTNGGAISTRSALDAGNSVATLDISATFEKNIAYANGGAFYNSFYSSNNLGKGDGVTVSGTFTENEAKLAGGAIYNDGTMDKDGNFGGVMTISDATFTNNIASKTGGAIHNSENAILTLKGDNTFTGNTANNKKNDIHNDGSLFVDGNLTLDGGITGNGDITFKNGASLTAELQQTTILAQSVTFDGNNKLNLKVANGLADADYDFIQASTLTGVDSLSIAENSVYNINLTDEGKIHIALKSSQELAESIDTPVTTQEANTLTAVLSTNGNATPLGNQLATEISNLLQSGASAQAVQAAKELAPTTSQVVAGVAKEASSTIARVSNQRMDSVKGTSGGDVTGAGLWIQGLYNHTKQNATSSSDGFKANSHGIAFGADTVIDSTVTLGLGYGYMNTDADSSGRDLDVDGHNFFLYGKYQPSQWYVSSILNYNYSKYTEEKSPLGISLKSKYDVNSYGAQIFTGYDMKNGLTPELGLRYLIVDADSYFDGAQRIRSKRDDMLTAVAGIKYQMKAYSRSGLTLKPSINLAATYDLISDNSNSNISVIGGSNYTVEGNRLHRFGVEAGAGVTATMGNLDLTLEYNGAFRQDYHSQGGMLKAKYHF